MIGLADNGLAFNSTINGSRAQHLNADIYHFSLPIIIYLFQKHHKNNNIHNTLHTKMAFGEVFVGALLQVLFEKLASAGIGELLKYVKGQKIDPSTIKNFENNLRMIAALLQDAEQQRIESAAFKISVEKLQDLAYDLDDVLDELATDAQLKLQQQGEDDDEDYGSMARNITCLQSAKTKVKSILACGSGVVQRFHCSGGDLPSKIEEINNRLQQIHTQGQGLGLADRIIKPDMQYPMEAAKQISGRETTSLVNEPVVFGRKEKKRDVIHELLKEESGNGNYVVITIVGNGGIGKTTLAQYVYNDQQLKDHFNIKAWVCVSDVFDVTRVTTDIINSSKNTSLKFSNLNQAQNELIKVIRDQRFLIVLDDIWNKNYVDWSQLQKPFQYGATGSKVIVTTRDLKIATMVRTNPTHPIFNLEGLSNEDCWRLFQQHVNEDSNDLVEMKDDITNKCKGLPLAAKALGGLFRKNMEKSQRQMILNNNIWTEESQVLPVLRLSYYHLPSHLKHTFAFCCILPKDYEFEEMEVILLWMAQGFLIEKRKGRMEDIGHLYFLDLVSLSLFERSPSNKKCYIMHDLVHDLAQWAAGDICRCVMDMTDMQGELERTRHLYITWSGIDHTLRIIQPIAEKLRTLICPAEDHIDGLNVGCPDSITRFRCMRTLILASETVEQLPECVGDLKHLRFLDLRFTKIQVFPNSIRKLCNLETLFLEHCCNLIKIENIRFLVRLRHLRFHQSLWEAMPWGIGKLTNLQSLGSIYLGVDCENGSILRELKGLNHLQGELSVFGLQNVRNVYDAQEAQLHEKKGLTKLYLEWDEDRDEIDDKNERDVLEKLRPYTCIKKFKLKGYMGMTLPAWLGDASFKHMVALKLIECRKCVCLPPFGQLPSLKKFVIEDMHGIKEVGFSVLGGLDCLEELCIRYCGSLITINEIPVSLLELSIGQCPELKKVEFKKSLSSLSTSSAPNKVCIDIYLCHSLVTLGQIPLSIESLEISNCKKLKCLLFSEMTLESKEEEESAGVTQEESDGVEGSGGSSMEVSEKQIQIDSPIELAHLLKLVITNCANFMSLPEDLLLPSVHTISFLGNERQEALPEQIHTFTSLKSLQIFNCPKIEKPPIGEWGLDLLTHLDRLTIREIGSSTDTVECIPGPHLHLPASSLSDLQIRGFKNLKSISCSSFPNLKTLYIRKCPKLENLVDYNSLPPKLPYVIIDECPMIQQQCKPDPNGVISFDVFGSQRYNIG